MDRLEYFRTVIKGLLSQHAEFVPSHGQIESRPVFDDHTDDYLLVDVGWDRTGRVHSVILHLAIRNGKIWIERDGTELGIADALLDAGISQESIVLGFYRPERRELTEFAVA